MVGKVKELFEKYKKARVRLEVGSETGIEEELSRPEWQLESQKTGKSLQVFGVKLTFRW